MIQYIATYELCIVTPLTGTHGFFKDLGETPNITAIYPALLATIRRPRS